MSKTKKPSALPGGESSGQGASRRSLPYADLLTEVVRKVKNEPFLFVIAIGALIIGLFVAVRIDSSNQRFVVVVLGVLAFSVLTGHYFLEAWKLRSPVGARQVRPSAHREQSGSANNIVGEHEAGTPIAASPTPAPAQPPSKSPTGRLDTHSFGAFAGDGDYQKLRNLYKDERISVSVVRDGLTGELSVIKDYPAEYFHPLTKLSLSSRHIILPKRRWQKGGRAFEEAPFIESWTLYEVVEAAETKPVVVRSLFEDWFTRLTDALVALQSHDPPILHNDISPSNVLVRKDNLDVCLIDFTLSETLDTPPGKVYGTQRYIDPLRVKGQRTLSSDLFSLGCVLYYMSTGNPPLRPNERGSEYEGNWWGLFLMDSQDKYTRAYRRMISLDPERRFPDARALKAFLSQKSGTKQVPPDPILLKLPDRRVVEMYDSHWEIQEPAAT